MSSGGSSAIDGDPDRVGHGSGGSYAVGMRIEMTEDAQRLLEKKGGTMSIDFIRPTG